MDRRPADVGRDLRRTLHRQLIERRHYVRYVALRTALWKLAELVLLAVANKLIFEGEPPETADLDWPPGPDETAPAD